MDIFTKPAAWYVLLGGNGALLIDSLAETDFVSAAVNAVAMVVSAVMVDRTKNKSRASSDTAQ